MSTTEIIEAGRYKFAITRNIQTYGHIIINHTYKVGGDYKDCINISYRYYNNTPIQAKIPHLLYEPECAIGITLEKGSGTEFIIKAALQYAYKDVPTIKKFEFEDNSHIDCIEKNLKNPPPRKAVRPVNLAFFSIAYHGKTWYESRFNAKMLDTKRYTEYKKSLEFLTNPKAKVPFINFLQNIGHSLTSVESIKQLEKYYTDATTYRAFFENIPKSKRCELLYGWLNTFMNNYIGKTFTTDGWYIDVNDMEAVEPQQTGGSSRQQYNIFSYKYTQNF